MGREGIDEKFNRARHVVSELAARVAEFMEKDPYRIERVESGSGDLSFVVRVAAHPPMAWSLLVGDAVHNARSALDHLAFALVVRDGGTPGDYTGFPIANERTGFGDLLRGRLRGAARSTRDSVRALEPWRGGDDRLWRLHRLDIVDKHRLLVPVGHVHDKLMMGMSIEAFGERIEIPPILDLSTVPKDGSPKGPLRDGAVLLHIPRDARSPSMETNATASFEVVFGEGEVVHGEQVVATLVDLVDHAATVVEPLVATLA